MTIICTQHGSFEQTPDSHCLSGKSGCPRCKASTGERKIYKVLVDLGITDFVCEKRFDDCFAPDTNLKMKFDFWIPRHNLIIEYDGHSHTSTVNFSGKLSEELMQSRLDRTRYLDDLKNTYVINKGIRLLRIPYTEYKNITSILADALK